LNNDASVPSTSPSQVKSPLQGRSPLQGSAIALLPKSALKVAAFAPSQSPSHSKSPSDTMSQNYYEAIAGYLWVNYPPVSIARIFISLA
jgi:hypothetical protein